MFSPSVRLRHDNWYGPTKISLEDWHIEQGYQHDGTSDVHTKQETSNEDDQEASQKYQATFII